MFKNSLALKLRIFYFINEVFFHLMVKGVPFNGTGHSDLGAYQEYGDSKNLSILQPSNLVKLTSIYHLESIHIPRKRRDYSGCSLNSYLIFGSYLIIKYKFSC